MKQCKAEEEQVGWGKGKMETGEVGPGGIREDGRVAQVQLCVFFVYLMCL